MQKYKVENKNGFAVGIKLNNPDREQNIMPKSFAKLTIDEIAYVDSISTLFKRGMLTVDDDDINEMLGYVEKNPNIIDEESIEKIIKGNINTMKKEISKLTEEFAKGKVMSVVKKCGSDLSVAKIKWLKQFFGKELFLDEIQ